MMHGNDTTDEETALLSRKGEQRSPTRLPKVQLGIVLLLQVCEPITSHSIYPYIAQLISGLDITGGDERKVGYYVGVMSLFFLIEAITVMQWSRLSDRIGRKPVLLLGLAGSSVSILLFGLSRTFWTLVISRCLCGLLNGNVGVMKSAMGELTDPSNRARGFSLMAVVWAAGSTLGPLMGGTFAHPYERFPAVFTSQFWIDYPYFLPCIAASSFLGFAFTITLLFLKETAPRYHKHGSASADSSPAQCSDRPVPLRELLVYPVLISVSNYMALAFLNIMLSALLPLFFAVPIHIGGLGFEPSTIGYIMGMSGVGNGLFQALFFARIVSRFGTRGIFIRSIMSFIPIYLLFPVMNAVAQRSGVNAMVWSIIALVLALMVLMDMGYGCVFMYVTASAPNKHSLGATNGLAQTCVSLTRAVGPVLSTSLFSLSVEHNLLGGYAIYVVLLGVSCLAILLAARLPEAVWKEQKGNDAEPGH